jgi:hypothetical protein
VKHEDKQGFVFAASVGAAIGVGVTATRAFEANLGSVLGLLAGTGLTVVVAVVLAFALQYLVKRTSRPVE